MWTLKGNEKTQKELDAYKSKLFFKKDNDNNQKKKTISLASVIWRMVIKQEPTYYQGNENSQRHQCRQGAFRSVEDIYSVHKNYVKEPVSREAIENAMDKLVAKRLIDQDFCLDVRRRVHSPRSLTTTLQQIKDVLRS